MTEARPRLAEIEACVFDAYGTVLDVSSAVTRSSAARLPQAEQLWRLWRQKQLEYTWLRSLMNRHADFWRVTGESLDHALEQLGLADPALRAELMQLYLQLDAYPDAAPALQRLKAAGLPASVLQPARSDEAYRVVLGPYATREQAEETGRGIGMPSFVVTTQDSPSQ